MVTYIYSANSADELKSFIEKYKENKSGDGAHQDIVVYRHFDVLRQSPEELAERCRERNIDSVMLSEDEPLSEGFNRAREIAKGDTLCYSFFGVTYDPWTTKAVNKAVKNHPDMEVFQIATLPEDGIPKDLRKDLGRGIPMELDDAEIPDTKIYSLFIRREVADEIPLRDLCPEDMGLDLYLRLGLRTGRILKLQNCVCYGNDEIADIFDNHIDSKKNDYYQKPLKESYLKLLEETMRERGSLPKWMQLAVFYNLVDKLQENLNNANKLVLADEEAGEFLDLAAEVAKYLDDDIILDNSRYKKPGVRFIIRNLLCYLKYDGNEELLGRSFYREKGKLFFSQRGISYNLTRDDRLIVKAMDVKNNKLVINCWFMTHMLYDYDPLAIRCCVSGREVIPEHRDYYSLDKVFGKSINKRYVFRVELPLEELFKKESSIYFFMMLEGKKSILPLDFNRAPSKLSNECPHRYWEIGDSHILEYSDNTLWVSRVTEEELLKREEKFQGEAIKSIRKLRHDQANLKENKTEGIKIKIRGRLEGWVMVARRNKYYSERKKLKGRRIWLYFDKLFKAGDNGEYAFRYAFNNDKSIESYYVINKDSPDYGRLKKEFGNRILAFGDEKTKLYALLAETVVATHPDIIEFFGYRGHGITLVKNLFNANLVCIAHGVTIQKNADYQNKLFDNTMFYTTSSKYEVEHILKPVYGYEEDEVALTGMARFDGLVNRDKKQILITPTWRRSLVGKAERNTTREYNEDFKTTAYYKIYNSLINDRDILESAKRNGYRVIFLLHPSMSTQIGDYDKNDYVDIIPASGDMSYEKILTESSLMITDYSGIHYDFGYMRKPVIYYQPREIPMRFEEGGMKFATMGFGPVCTEYREAVKLITEYMDSGCAMPEEYRKRADDFFAFDDHNNCMRIHEAIKKWADERKAGNSLLYDHS